MAYPFLPNNQNLVMPKFNDIMTRDIVFYDKEYKDVCAGFCKARNINYLPAIHDSNLGFKYSEEKNSFEQFAIKATNCVNSGESIFKRGVINKFKNNKILFVMENGELEGVVHFCDYNRPPVYEEIYKKLYKLERGLIHLISEYAGKSVDELKKFIDSQPSHNGDKLLEKHDFSKLKINLKDVMEFAFQTDLLRIRNIDKITMIRNKIAHSKDLIAKESYKKGSLMYNFQSIKNLIEGNLALDIAIKQVANRAYIMKADFHDNFGLKVSSVFDETFS